MCSPMNYYRFSVDELAAKVRDMLDRGRRDDKELSGRYYDPKRWGDAENALAELVRRLLSSPHKEKVS